MELPGVALGAVAADAFATGLRAMRLGDEETARRAQEELGQAIESARRSDEEEGKNIYAGANDDSQFEVARILEMELAALLLAHDQQIEESLSLLTEASTAEEARPLQYGPPAVVKPSHELMGEILLLAGRPAEAQVQFEKALSRAPRRTLSVVGLADAAQRAGDEVTAHEARLMYKEIWKGAAESRPASP